MNATECESEASVFDQRSAILLLLSPGRYPAPSTRQNSKLEFSCDRLPNVLRVVPSILQPGRFLEQLLELYNRHPCSTVSSCHMYQ